MLDITDAPRSRDGLIGALAELLGTPRREELEKFITRQEERFWGLTGITPPRLGRSFAAVATPPASAKEVRDSYRAYGEAMAAAAQARDKLIEHGVPMPSFPITLEAEAHRTLAAASGIDTRPRRTDGKPKEICALYALQLVEEFSTKPASTTDAGMYRSVTSMLWELLTSESDADLERHCKAALRKKTKTIVSQVERLLHYVIAASMPQVRPALYKRSGSSLTFCQPRAFSC
jgi:hypothetical protein